MKGRAGAGAAGRLVGARLVGFLAGRVARLGGGFRVGRLEGRVAFRVLGIGFAFARFGATARFGDRGFRAVAFGRAFRAFGVRLAEGGGRLAMARAGGFLRALAARGNGAPYRRLA